MSAITRIAVECWVGQGRHVTQCEQPKEADLRRLFEMLNGSSEDTLSIETSDRGSMLVGGGPHRFVAVCFLPDGASFHVERSSKEEGVELLQVGGQTGDYPRRYVVDREAALQIASSYFASYSMDEAFTWVRDVAPEKEWCEYSEEAEPTRPPETTRGM